MMRKGPGTKALMTPAIVRRYAKKGMTLEQIGALYGIGKQRVSTIISEDEALKTAWSEGHSQLLDELLDHLLIRAKSNDILLMFLLKSRFGFVEEQYRVGKVVDAENAPKIHVYLPDNERETPLLASIKPAD